MVREGASDIARCAGKRGDFLRGVADDIVSEHEQGAP
jgi:hypothetical protein